MGDLVISVQLQQRTKAFALRVIRLFNALPKGEVARTLGRQPLRASTSVAATYRAACHAKSRKDFICKITTAEEECDDSVFWMEMLVDAGLISEQKLRPLMQEGSEILKIVIASIRTAKRGNNLNAVRGANSISHSALRISTL
jgi:four helix bundle protein